MPWWGWLLLVVVAVVVVPIKLRVLKSMLNKNKEHSDF